jgi:hypothetical protein
MRVEDCDLRLSSIQRGSEVASYPHWLKQH